VTVFREYTAGDEEQTIYFRHHVADLRFVSFDGQWYCEILPTYHYTADGKEDSRLEADALSGIKALERNHPERIVSWGIEGKELQSRPVRKDGAKPGGGPFDPRRYLDALENPFPDARV
jgi:hypothetical protein